MSTQTATQHAASHSRAEVASWRLRLLLVLGPLASLGGVVWAIVQPYRVTLLHPHGQGFWWLAIEPPLMVMIAGALFHVFVARMLLEDLAEE
jgi:ABC-type uncharacterized transport system permease subunit